MCGFKAKATREFWTGTLVTLPLLTLQVKQQLRKVGISFLVASCHHDPFEKTGGPTCALGAQSIWPRKAILCNKLCNSKNCCCWICLKCERLLMSIFLCNKACFETHPIKSVAFCSLNDTAWPHKKELRCNNKTSKERGVYSSNVWLLPGHIEAESQPTANLGCRHSYPIKLSLRGLAFHIRNLGFVPGLFLSWNILAAWMCLQT